MNQEKLRPFPFIPSNSLLVFLFQRVFVLKIENLNKDWNKKPEIKWNSKKIEKYFFSRLRMLMNRGVNQMTKNIQDTYDSSTTKMSF